MIDEKDTDTTNPEVLAEVTHIDTLRIDKMRERGHLPSMFEEFEILRIKFMYDKLTDPQEAIKFVTLLKYFAENGPSEAMRLSCSFMLERYVKKFEL